jgi:hypothetical protein
MSRPPPTSAVSGGRLDVEVTASSGFPFTLDGKLSALDRGRAKSPNDVVGSRLANLDERVAVGDPESPLAGRALHGFARIPREDFVRLAVPPRSSGGARSKLSAAAKNGWAAGTSLRSRLRSSAERRSSSPGRNSLWSVH